MMSKFCGKITQYYEPGYVKKNNTQSQWAYTAQLMINDAHGT